MLYKTLALSTFLFGTVVNAADPPACYATFSSSKSYTDSDPVSRISYVTTELKCCTKTVTCAGGTSGCSSSTSGTDGTKKVGCTTEGTDGCTCTDNGTTDTYNNPACKSTESEISTKVANNYDCKEQVWCNDAGRQPGTQYEDTAWTKVEVCNVSYCVSILLYGCVGPCLFNCVILFHVRYNILCFTNTKIISPPLSPSLHNTARPSHGNTRCTCELEYSHTRMSRGMGIRRILRQEFHCHIRGFQRVQNRVPMCQRCQPSLLW